jgi:hypothetical protein
MVIFKYGIVMKYEILVLLIFYRHIVITSVIPDNLIGRYRKVPLFWGLPRYGDGFLVGWDKLKGRNECMPIHVRGRFQHMFPISNDART